MDNAIARQVVTSPCVSSDTIARPLKARDALIPRQGRRSVAVAMVGVSPPDSLACADCNMCDRRRTGHVGV